MLVAAGMERTHWDAAQHGESNATHWMQLGILRIQAGG